MGDPSGSAQAQQLLERGAGLYESGKLYDALLCWKRVLELDPGNEIATEYLRFIEDNFQIGVDAFMAHHEAPSVPPVPVSGPPPIAPHEGSVEEAIGDLDWSEILEDPSGTSVPPPVAESALGEEDFFADLEPGSLTAPPGEEADAWGATALGLADPPAEVAAPDGALGGDPLAMDVSAFSQPFESAELRVNTLRGTDGPVELPSSSSEATVDEELASLPGWLDLSEPGAGDGEQVPLLSPIQHQPLGVMQRDLTEMSDESIEVMLDRDFKAWEDQDLAELGMRVQPDDVSADALAAVGEHALASPTVRSEPPPAANPQPVATPTAPSEPHTAPAGTDPAVEGRPGATSAPPAHDLFARPFDRATPPPMPAGPAEADDSLEDWSGLMEASVEVPFEAMKIDGPRLDANTDEHRAIDLPFALPDEQGEARAPGGLLEFGEDEFQEVDLDELARLMPDEPVDGALPPEGLADPADSTERSVPVSPLAAAALGPEPVFALDDAFGVSEALDALPDDAASLPVIDSGGGLLGPDADDDLTDFDDDDLDLPDFDLSAPPLANSMEALDRLDSPAPASGDDEDPLAMLDAAFDAFEDAGASAADADPLEGLDAGFDDEVFGDDAFGFGPSEPETVVPAPSATGSGAFVRKPSRPGRSAERQAERDRASAPPASPAPPSASDLERLLRAGMAEIDAARAGTPKTREAPEIRRLIKAPPPDTDYDGLMREARRRQQAGAFTGSLELVEQVLAGRPDHVEARRYLEENTTRLLSMYRSRLGRLSKAPTVKLRPQEIIWQSLDHRAGFVLAQVDGHTSYEDIIEISGMGELEATRVLARLVQFGVIG